MITNNYSLTINGYECKLNKPLKFYQGDSLHLIFTVNQYEWVINNGNRVRAIMPINPLRAFLIIENPEDENTDTIESAFVENDEIHFHIDSKYTSFVGVGRMQLVLADDGCCSVTIPEFTYEIKKNITDKLLHLSKTTLIDTDNKVLMTDSGDDMITGLALSTESNTSKYIKDLPNKEAIDGQESVLIQDQEGTKNVNMKVLLDDINSRTNLADIQNQITETNTQLSDLKEHCTGGNGMQAHSHVNKTILDAFSQSENDELLFNGKKVIADIEEGGVSEGNLDEELLKKINKVNYVEQRINAITVINENVSSSPLEKTSNIQAYSTEYDNEFNIITHKYTYTDLCYLSFVFDVSKYNGETVESVFSGHLKGITPIKGSVIQLNTISKLPPNPSITSYLQNMDNATSMYNKDYTNTKTITMNSDKIMLQFAVRRSDGLQSEMHFDFLFTYSVNGESLKPIYAGTYFKADETTVNNAKVGINMISDITTTNDKETEILFTTKNINMTGATVILSVDGSEVTKTPTLVDGNNYSLYHEFSTIKSYICFIKITEKSGTEYGSNSFTVKSKDPNDISPNSVWVNPDKILVNNKSLSTKISEIEEMIMRLSSELYGKKICFIGDSICEQGTFINPLVTKTGCIVQNLGLSGSGWIARKPQNYIARIDQIEDIPDILVFYGSTNDISVSSLGTLGDKDETTYYGAIRSTLEKAILKFKHNTKYCVITPLPTYYLGRGVRESFVDEYGSGSGSTPLSLNKMSIALREVSEALSIPCLDLYHCSNFFPVFPDGNVTGDGVHLSSQVAPISTIQKFLESIV